MIPASRAVQAQSQNPPYLSSMPSVDRVKKAMEVSDPKETALRQIGAFWQLQEVVKALSGHREFRGYLPDEKKLLDAYWTAAYQIGLGPDSAFPGPYKGAQHLSEYAPYRYSRIDPRFGVEGLDLFHAVLTPAIQAPFDQVVGVERGKIALRSREDSIARAEGERRMTQPAGAQPPGALPQPPMTQLQRMLGHFGAELRIESEPDGARRITLVGYPELTGAPITVPGDPSSAAKWPSMRS